MTRLFWTYPRGIMWLTSISDPRKQRVAARPMQLPPVSERRGREIDGFRLRGSQQLSLSACLRRLLINTGKEPPLGPVTRAHRFGQPRRRVPPRGRLHFRCGRNFLKRAPPTFWPMEHHSSSQVTGSTFVTYG